MPAMITLNLRYLGQLLNFFSNNEYFVCRAKDILVEIDAYFFLDLAWHTTTVKHSIQIELWALDHEIVGNLQNLKTAIFQ